jgi:hypothetical protein
MAAEGRDAEPRKARRKLAAGHICLTVIGVYNGRRALSGAMGGSHIVRPGLRLVLALLLTLLLIVYGGKWLFPERSDSPEELTKKALGAETAKEQELATLELGRFRKNSPDRRYRGDARLHLERVFKESKTPEVRAAAIHGLGNQYDYDLMEQFLDCLNDESLTVRAEAGAMIQSMISVDRKFDPLEPAEKRQAAVERIRQSWKEFQAPRGGKPSRLEIWKARLAAEE